MSNQKYVLQLDKSIEVFGRTLYRIKALTSFGNVSIGDEGGYIEKEDNLSISGDAWVYGNANVYDDAKVYDDASVSGNAWVYGNASVSGDASVYDDAKVSGDAWVSGDASVYDDAWVSGDASVYDDARVYGNARVSGDASVYGIMNISNLAISITLPTWSVTYSENNFISIGCRVYKVEEWANFTDEEISDMDTKALSWWKIYKESILTLAGTITNG